MLKTTVTTSLYFQLSFPPRDFKSRFDIAFRISPPFEFKLEDPAYFLLGLARKSVIEDTTSGSREVPSNEDGGVSGWLALPAFLVLFDDRPFLDDLRLPVGVVPELLDRWTFLGFPLKDGEPTMVPLAVRLMTWREQFLELFFGRDNAVPKNYKTFSSL